MSPKVDAFLERETQWRDAFEKLRAIILGCGLAEDLKWGQPCYALDGKNVVLIHGFKDYCAILFMKGALLEDPNGILIQQTEHVQSARQVRFVDSGEVVQLEPVLEAYIREAIEVEKAGLKIEKKPTAAFAVPDELKTALDKDPSLKAGFEALTPGRQRGYLLHIAAPKQSKTREARIEKLTPKILAGKGWDE